MARQRQPLRTPSRRGAEPQRARRESRQTVLTLYGRDIAKLDRFVSQGQRAALRDDREFEGVTLAVDLNGAITVNAVGMTSLRL